MKKFIICSSNSILVKSLYGILRDDGHAVEISEHPAIAVQKIMNEHYDFLVIDSEPFGLSAEDAAEIVKQIAPGIRILFVGNRRDTERSEESSLDLEEFKKSVKSLAICER